MFNNKVVIACCLMQYWEIFSLILIFSYYVTCLTACEIGCKISETQKIFPKLHLPSCGNYLLVLTNVKKTRFQRKSLNWNLKPKLIKLTIGESQCHGITQMFSCLKQCCVPVVRSYFMKFYFAKWTPSKNITFKKNCT